MRLDIAEGPTLTRQSAEGLATITQQESRLMMSRDQLGTFEHGLGPSPNPLLRWKKDPGKNKENRYMLGRKIVLPVESSVITKVIH
jgi:hypothetical protein